MGHIERARDIGSVCPHCGAESSRYLGPCEVCDKSVCDHCGNVQFIGGERNFTHRDCLRHHDQGFKMIKFKK